MENTYLQTNNYNWIAKTKAIFKKILFTLLLFQVAVTPVGVIIYLLIGKDTLWGEILFRCNFAVALGALYLYLRKKKQSNFYLSFIQWNAHSVRDFLLGALMVIVPLLLCVVLMLYFDVFTYRGWAASNFTFWELLAATVLFGLLSTFIAASTEEFFFRVYLLHKLKLLSGNKHLAIFLNALAFAAMHAFSGLLPWIGIFMTGILLAWLFDKTKSFGLVAGFHTAWNFMHFLFFMPKEEAYIPHFLMATDIKKMYLGDVMDLFGFAALLLSFLLFKLLEKRFFPPAALPQQEPATDRPSPQALVTNS